MADDRYSRVYYHGYLMDKMTRDALIAMEKRLGYELSIMQGSYHTGVSKSAGTHDGGGCLDLAPALHDSKIMAARMCGFAAWYRTPAQGFPYHIHMCQIGNARMASGAATQVTAYKAGYNGLGYLGRQGYDDGPRVWKRLARYGMRKCFPTWDYVNKRVVYKP